MLNQKLKTGKRIGTAGRLDGDNANQELRYIEMKHYE